MANDHYISAGLIVIDNSSGATANSQYISAGLVPTDTTTGDLSIDVHDCSDVLLTLDGGK